MPDSSQNQDSEGAHLAVNNLLHRTEEDLIGRAEEKEEDEENVEKEEANPGTTGIRCYFPAALSRPGGEKTEFNFELFLFDSLRLEAGLFPNDSHEPLVFQSVEECSRYCQRFVQAMRERKAGHNHLHQQPTQENTTPRLDKRALFHTCRQALGPKLTTGNATFDCNLDQLRIDLFGNVMALFAPKWSDISVQLTHGFPGHLITELHRGMLPGNITAATLVSNRAV